MFNILSKKLFGKNCKNLLKSLMICVIVYAGLSNLNQNIDVAHSVLMFVNLAFSSAVMIQFLGSKDNAGYLKGYFAMPFEKKNFILGYAATMGIYVFTTRTLLIYALILAFAKISTLEILLILTEYIFVCLGTMAVFAYFSDKKYISLIISVIGIAMCFLLPSSPVSAVIYLVAALLLMLVLLNTNPYRFMINHSGTLQKTKSTKNSHFLVAKYIMRYILSNRTYIISPIVILAFICFIVINMKKSGFDDGILVGIALTSMNTPLGIVVSSNRGLHKKLDSMPSKFKNFFLPYACILFIYYLIISAILVTVVSFFGINISVKIIVAAILFSAQAAAAAAFMEDKKHLTNWNVETDLWHHPRKYIVPAVLALEAGLLSLI